LLLPLSPFTAKRRVKFGINPRETAVNRTFKNIFYSIFQGFFIIRQRVSNSFNSLLNDIKIFLLYAHKKF